MAPSPPSSSSPRTRADAAPDKTSGKGAGKAPAQPAAGGLLEAIRQIRLEAGRITWPTRAQIWGNTLVVILLTALVSVGILIVDNVLFGIIWLLTEAIPKQLPH